MFENGKMKNISTLTVPVIFLSAILNGESNGNNTARSLELGVLPRRPCKLKVITISHVAKGPSSLHIKFLVDYHSKNMLIWTLLFCFYKLLFKRYDTMSTKYDWGAVPLLSAQQTIIYPKGCYSFNFLLGQFFLPTVRNWRTKKRRDMHFACEECKWWVHLN